MIHAECLKIITTVAVTLCEDRPPPPAHELLAIITGYEEKRGQLNAFRRYLKNGPDAIVEAVHGALIMHNQP